MHLPPSPPPISFALFFIMFHLRAFKPVPVHSEYFLLQPGTNMIVTSMISADSSFRDIFRCQLRTIVVTSRVVKISFRRLGIKVQLLDMASSVPIYVRTYLHCTETHAAQGLAHPLQVVQPAGPHISLRSPR